MPYKNESSSALITWDFEVGVNTLRTRYGHSDGKRWKQYTPGFIVDDERWPPRPISEQHYQLARRQHDRDAKASQV